MRLLAVIIGCCRLFGCVIESLPVGAGPVFGWLSLYSVLCLDHNVAKAAAVVPS